MEENNLDKLTPVTYFAKDGDYVTDLPDVNWMMITPFKIACMNALEQIKLTTQLVRETDLTDEVVENQDYMMTTFANVVIDYILTNIEYSLRAVGCSFIDILKGGFIYDENTPYERHYEFEFPVGLLKDGVIIKRIEDFVNVKEIVKVADLRLLNDHYDRTVIANGTIMVRMRSIMMNIHSYLSRAYFNRMIEDTAAYYLNHPEFAIQFYRSYVDEDFNSFTHDGFNNAYISFTSVLREMMNPFLKNFMDCLQKIAIVATYMLTAGTGNMDSVETYLEDNMFLYDIIEENQSKEEINNE